MVPDCGGNQWLRRTRSSAELKLAASGLRTLGQSFISGLGQGVGDDGIACFGSSGAVSTCDDNDELPVAVV